jgi:hypothetical protein
MEGRPFETDRPDPARLRISDHDRHQVAEVLRQAAGEGRIDLEELDERLEATYKAKTYGDLVPITADLPARTTDGGALMLPTAPPPVPAQAVPAGSPRPMVPAAVYPSSLSFMGECTRRGVWRLPEQHSAFSLMGSVTLDLREAIFEAREVTITAVAIMAGIDIIVNPQTQVIVDGVGIMGDFSQARDKAPAQITAGSPVVRVKGLALMAGVTVRRRAMPGDTRKRITGSR